MTIANAQLQAKNTELQDAISGLKKDIAIGQSLMMQEIRAMREESRARAEEEREKLMEDVQRQMKVALVTKSSEKEKGGGAVGDFRPPSARKGGHGHSHSKRHGPKGSAKQ